MKISIRTFFQRLLTYPLLLPIMLLYSMVNNKKLVLNFFYRLRGFPHGLYKNNLRLASYTGLEILFPFEEDPAFDDVWLRDVYQEYSPSKEDIVIDVGAHMGFFALKIARSVKKVIAIEPDPSNLRFLLTNIEINNLPQKISNYNCALGEKLGVAFLDRSSYGYGRSKVSDKETACSCTINTVDAIVEKEALQYISLIKIDTEGYELQILKGAVKSLAAYKPDLIIAAYHFPQEYLIVSDFLRKQHYLVKKYYMPLFLSRKKEIYLFATADDTLQKKKKIFR
jgi:FkbM family methyltransferase